MRVVTKGNVQQAWSIEVTCTGHGLERYNDRKGCGAVLEISREDVYFSPGQMMERDDSSYGAIRCPECGVMTKLRKEEMPVPMYLEGAPAYHPISKLFDLVLQSRRNSQRGAPDDR